MLNFCYLCMGEVFYHFLNKGQSYCMAGIKTAILNGIGAKVVLISVIH